MNTEEQVQKDRVMGRCTYCEPQIAPGEFLKLNILGGCKVCGRQPLFGNIIKENNF